jgi:hypothetical protein
MCRNYLIMCPFRGPGCPRWKALIRLGGGEGGNTAREKKGKERKGGGGERGLWVGGWERRRNRKEGGFRVSGRVCINSFSPSSHLLDPTFWKGLIKRHIVGKSSVFYKKHCRQIRCFFFKTHCGQIRWFLSHIVGKLGALKKKDTLRANKVFLKDMWEN